MANNHKMNVTNYQSCEKPIQSCKVVGGTEVVLKDAGFLK